MREERKSTQVSDRDKEILLAVIKGDKNEVMQVLERSKVVHDLGSVVGLKYNIQILDGQK
jgi:hypothetical protein